MGNDASQCCACGCSVPITARTSSEWFASEACQKSWMVRLLGPALPAPEPRPAIPQQTPADHDDPWADVFTDRGTWPTGVHAIHTPAGVLRRR